MTDPAEDLANELAADALLDKCPASDLPAWPGNALAGGWATVDGTPPVLPAPRWDATTKEEK